MNELSADFFHSLHTWCQKEIEPNISHDDQQGIFSLELYQKMGVFGLTGLPIAEKHGGLAANFTSYCQALEIISEYSVPYAVTLSVSLMAQGILENFGTEIQKKVLPLLTSGEQIAAFALSESHSGSDAASLKTTAKKVSGGYILNGSKMWITSAGVAKQYIVMARTGGEGAKGISAFLIEDSTPGFSYGKAEMKMGWRTSPTRELIFKDCFLPQSCLIGAEGAGFTIAKAGLDKGRVTIGAIAVGCAQRAFREAIKYSQTRFQFNQPLFEFQGLQFMLADMATDIEAARLLVHSAAEHIDKKLSATKLASMAKMRASDTAMKVTTDAVQILGGVGYTVEYPVERFMRDAKVLQIVEGTNQIQRLVIARKLKEEYPA
jgi:butyryl-CoA dehydrogenase